MSRSPLQQDPSLDRNVITATILIAVVMFVWLWFVAPPPSEQAAQSPAGEDTAAVAEGPETLPSDTAADTSPSLSQEEEQQPQEEAVTLQEEVTLPDDATIAGSEEGEERFITVETDLYEARFSTKGATLVSFLLKDYRKFDQETPVQMIDSTGGGAPSLAFTTPANHNVDTRAFYFEPNVQGDTFRVDEGQASLSFETRLGEGSLRMTYVFTPGEYELNLSVEHENPAAYMARNTYEVVWNGGVPFSEDDPEGEALSSGAYARSGGEIVNVMLSDDTSQETSLRGSVSWTAVKSKYFTAVVLPQGETFGATLAGERTGAVDSPQLEEHYTTRLEVPAGAEGADEYQLYVGPMEYYRISAYGENLYGMVDYGWAVFEWMTRPLAQYIFIPAFTLLSSFIPSYGLVIIILAFLIKMLVYPLTKRSYMSMAKMRELQPQMETIREKYGDNPQKQQEEMMKMYKETGVNPIGGCLPMFLQYPIIIALWQFLPNSIEIRQQGFLWAPDLSAPDIILNLPFTIPFYGDYVAGFTLLMGLSLVVQMQVQSTGGSNPQMKIFQYVIPVIIFAVFNGLAAGLSLYYLTYNVITAIQQKIINRQIEEEKDSDKNGRGSRKDASSVEKKEKSLLGRLMG